MRALVLVLSFALAGCGTQSGAAPKPAAASPPRVAARTPAQRRDVALLHRDVEAIKRAAARVDHVTLMGTPALQRTTSAFLDRLDRSSLEPKMKNRMIDFAASAAAGSCEQCFQMLEAARPIPEIAH
jgi:hypothetical protein